MEWSAICESVKRLQYEADSVEKELKECKVKVLEVEEQVEVAEKAQLVVQDVAEKLQTKVHAGIASVVTRCLESVFGEDAYEFRIVVEQKRGKTEARFVLERDGVEVDPLGAAGGGVVDVVAMALRLAALIMTRPKKRMLLVLDEPFRFVSREYLPYVAKLLEELSVEMQMQIIMVTHVEELTGVGTVYATEQLGRNRKNGGIGTEPNQNRPTH